MEQSYKEKYEQALAHAREIHRNEEEKRRDMEFIFPELAESEDEKIRKQIVNAIHDYAKRLEEKIPTEWLAWLEKQGEKKSVDDLTQQEAMDIAVAKCFEQGGQKDSVVDFKAKDWYVSKVDGKIRNIYHSVDKVEPKFHEGNLVVDNCGYVWKIEGIINQFYILEGVEGGKSHPTIEWVNKTYHLWTIQDAKDGDVLATDKSVFIYAKVLYSKPYAYCGVDKFGVFKDNSLKHDWANSVDNIHPATKEQRDLLFQKMNEAGYEWDAENKQLNKIHIVHDTYCQDNCKGFQETGKCFADGECKAKREAEQKKEENKGNLGGNSSNWSEEDESILQGIWDEILANKHDAEECEWKTYDKFLNWLKSLKPQNRWKPSSKQISQLQTVIDTYGKKGIYDPILTELLFQLKELYFS